MFFFFPFAAGLTATPQAARPKTPAPLPLLPIPAKQTEGRSEESFANTVSYAGTFGTDLIRKMISSYATSLTALSSRMSDFFAYISAWLAFDRMARQTHSMMAMGFKAFGLPSPQPVYSGMSVPFFPFGSPSVPPFGGTGFGGAPSNPMAALTDMITPWMSLWAPAKPAQSPAPSPRKTIPLALAFSMQGFAWSFSAG